MIRQLRKRFTGIALLSVAAVLLLLVGSINVMNYLNVVRNAEMRLELIDRGGPRGDDVRPPEGERPDEAREETGNGGADGREHKKRFALFGFSDVLSAEAPFDSRFFTVTLDGAGKTLSVDTGNVAATTAEEAETLAAGLYEKGREKGFSGTYRYASAETGDGIRYVFLDCSRELSTFYNFLGVSLIVSAVGVGLVYLLVRVLSGIALRPAAESYEKQKRFITDASHEIKTPLAVIGAANEVIEMVSGESEWTESISKQISRLTALTEKLVMLSRMDEESYRPASAPFSLTDAVREIGDSFSPVAEARNRNYTVDAQEGVSFNGDEAAFRQLISLLIDNAMKYSPEGGRVAVRLQKTGKTTELTVENDTDQTEKGPHPELFERFYRADKSRSSATGGHGIGLSVAQAIVHAHKGKITAESPDGNTMVFRVVLKD